MTLVKLFSNEETFDRVRSFGHFKALTERAPPRYLYHYTSSRGLLGIVSSKSLWMSDSQALNDEKELRYFKETVELAAHNLCNKNASHKLPDSRKNLIELLERYSLVTTGGIFVTSFSENGDQLSQWRAYTGGLPGFSLGIPGGKLAEQVVESSHVSAGAATIFPKLIVQQPQL